MTPPPPRGRVVTVSTRLVAITGKVTKVDHRHVFVGGQRVARRAVRSWRPAA